MTLRKRILAGLATGLLLVPLLVACSQVDSGGENSSNVDQKSSTSDNQLLSMKEIVGTKWEYKGKVIEFTKEPFKSITSQYSLPNTAYKSDTKTAYDPNLPIGLNTKDQTPLYKVNNESITKYRTNYYQTTDGKTPYPYYYALTTYFPSQVDGSSMCNGNASDTAWNQGSDSLYLDIMTQNYGGEPSKGCFIINATNQKMAVKAIQYTGGMEQDNEYLNFFGEGAQEEAKVNNNEITLTRKM